MLPVLRNHGGNESTPDPATKSFQTSCLAVWDVDQVGLVNQWEQVWFSTFQLWSSGSFWVIGFSSSTQSEGRLHLSTRWGKFQTNQAVWLSPWLEEITCGGNYCLGLWEVCSFGSYCYLDQLEYVAIQGLVNETVVLICPLADCGIQVNADFRFFNSEWMRG